jgi:hypothetical protein
MAGSEIGYAISMDGASSGALDRLGTGKKLGFDR